MKKMKKMESTKCTNKQLVELMKGLMEVKDLKGAKFSLTVLENVNVINDVLRPIDKIITPSEEFMELAKQVQAIEKEEISLEEKQAKVQVIEEENPELVNIRKAQIDAVNLELEKETTAKLITISLEDLPDDITPQQLLGINLIIKQ